MENNTSLNENFIEALKERAKELNCFYKVEEILNSRLLSLPEIFMAIVRVIPEGWQFPEVCQARIVHEGHSYQTEEYQISICKDAADITLSDRTIGVVEVSYNKEIPRHKEGYFLEKEHKLLRTIADRIGQTILQRQLGKMFHEWEAAKQSVSENKDNEWAVIINLLERVDPGLLFHICRKMINYLFLLNVPEALEILHKPEADNAVVNNMPIKKLPMDNLFNICDRTFRIAEKYLSSEEITLRLKKWINEEKAYGIIDSLEKVDASVADIVQAINRSRNQSDDPEMLYSPAERSMKVSLIRRFLSDKLEYINIAKQYVDVSDFYNIVNRIVFPPGSRGKLGGKSAGLFLAEQILKRERKNNPLLREVKIPKTWYIVTDEVIDFLHNNDLQELNEQKYKTLHEIRIDYQSVIQLMKNSTFTPEIVKSLSVVLDDFGKVPLIVRSSSNLEDQVGAAFSGKYKSLFLANQGSKGERLEALMDAIIEVYSSLFNPDSIQYRMEKGLLDASEEMGIMIQEVVGTKVGRYFMPAYAGVAFSKNVFKWSSKIDQGDGLVRLVPGLGTRAVDRISDDFPVLISPGQPYIKVNTAPEDIRHYSPKKTDVINLEKNAFESIEIKALCKEYGAQIPEALNIFSIFNEGSITHQASGNINFEKDELIVTFDGLITSTGFIKQIDLILKTLQEKMDFPVDIEFASDGRDFYLLQCRPQCFTEGTMPGSIPKDVDKKDIIFSGNKYISNGTVPDISYLIYIDPGGYNQLYNMESMARVGRAVGLLNHILPKRHFVIMGPGRFGSRDDMTLGVPVGYADINNAALLAEMSGRKSGFVPELSFGTHFFQDLIEANIHYLPLYPDDEGIIFNEKFLTRSDNLLGKLLPEFKELDNVIRVIDILMETYGRVLKISMNADLNEAIGYLTDPEASIADTKMPVVYSEPRYSDDFWRWRHYMAEKLALNLDASHFGVKGMYLFGSTNNATAGPGSDIDLLIHFEGTDKQRTELLTWLGGWSLCLNEMNYLKTGYSTRGLLDIHIVTDEDIEKKAPFANKIGAVTDPAHPLKINC